MKLYDVKVTDVAFDDITGIYHYISDVLQNSSAASKIFAAIYRKIFSLNIFPDGYKKIRDTNFRKVRARGYDVIYSIDQNTHTVYIEHVFYSRRDITKLL